MIANIQSAQNVVLRRIICGIVKNGDDVRQDQMVIQMIRLMNKLLNDVNLNLCLSPYDVVAMK